MYSVFMESQSAVLEDVLLKFLTLLLAKLQGRCRSITWMVDRSLRLTNSTTFCWLQIISGEQPDNSGDWSSALPTLYRGDRVLPEDVVRQWTEYTEFLLWQIWDSEMMYCDCWYVNFCWSLVQRAPSCSFTHNVDTFSIIQIDGKGGSVWSGPKCQRDDQWNPQQYLTWILLLCEYFLFLVCGIRALGRCFPFFPDMLEWTTRMWQFTVFGLSRNKSALLTSIL